MAKDWTSESYIYPEDCQRWENKAPSTSATISSDGLMSKEDKIKLNGISAGADKTPGLATNTTSGLMSGADKAKLGGIEAGANKYILPSTLPSTMITQDSTHRFVTDAEKTSWNSKSTLLLGETSTTAYRGDRGKIAYDHSQAAHAPVDAQKNIPIATSSQANSGTSNDVVMTPLRTKDQLDTLRPLASKEVAEAGLSTSQVMTPLRTREALNAIRPYATGDEAKIGTNAGSVMSPILTKMAIESQRPFANYSEAESGANVQKIMTPRLVEAFFEKQNILVFFDNTKRLSDRLNTFRVGVTYSAVTVNHEVENYNLEKVFLHYVRLTTYRVNNGMGFQILEEFGTTSLSGNIHYPVRAERISNDGINWSEWVFSDFMKKSSQSEATKGTNNTTYMTPLRTKESIENLRPYASKDEAESGVNNSKIMTPTRTKEAFNRFLVSNPKSFSIDGYRLTISGNYQKSFKQLSVTLSLPIKYNSLGNTTIRAKAFVRARITYKGGNSSIVKINLLGNFNPSNGVGINTTVSMKGSFNENSLDDITDITILKDTFDVNFITFDSTITNTSNYNFLTQIAYDFQDTKAILV